MHPVNFLLSPVDTHRRDLSRKQEARLVQKPILQKVEDSVRAPESLNDSVLISLTDNAARRAAAETTPKALSDTLFALVSQIRQILYGTAAGHWSDVPASSIVELLALATPSLQMNCLPSVNVGDLVYQSPTYANNAITAVDNLATPPVMGIVLSKVTPGVANVYYHGPIPTALPQGVVFLGVDGTFSSLVPAAGYVQHLGVSFGNGTMLFNPSLARAKRAI